MLKLRDWKVWGRCMPRGRLDITRATLLRDFTFSKKMLNFFTPSTRNNLESTQSYWVGLKMGGFLLAYRTLVFEDVETVYRGKLESQGNYDKHFLFGWTAQYNILKTTRGTLGAPDYVDLKYMQLRDSRAHEVDCHVALFDAENTVPFTFRKFLVPSHANLEDSHNAPVKTEIEVPSRSPYLGALWSMHFISINFKEAAKIWYWFK